MRLAGLFCGGGVLFIPGHGAPPAGFADEAAGPFGGFRRTLGRSGCTGLAATRLHAGPADTGLRTRLHATGLTSTGLHATGPTNTGPTNTGPTNTGPTNTGPTDIGANVRAA